MSVPCLDWELDDQTAFRPGFSLGHGRGDAAELVHAVLREGHPETGAAAAAAVLLLRPAVPLRAPVSTTAATLRASGRGRARGQPGLPQRAHSEGSRGRARAAGRLHIIGGGSEQSGGRSGHGRARLW